MVLCEYCGSEWVVKNGIPYGYQKYKCTDCGRTFTFRKWKNYNHSDEVIEKVLLMRKAGRSYNYISTQTGIPRSTVQNICQVRK